MIHYYKFRQDTLDPVPARDVYVKRPPGRGWPEECPPIRAANACGFDILASFDLTFIQRKPTPSNPCPWRVEPDIVLTSDFDWAATDDAEGAPLTQQYAWFWEKGQKLPHPISDNVYEAIKNQLKISSLLYLKTDPNEQLLMTDIPNLVRPFRTVSALVDTDWYPASYCYHIAIELDPAHKKIEIKKGDPLCRMMVVRRDTYFAKQMTPEEFDTFFERGQGWLSTHGRPHEAAEDSGHLDITHTYSKQQLKSRFVTMK
ncbi:MAG: hypothetical protein QM770_19490 [Tepidisphaeraceae bacterium]